MERGFYNDDFEQLIRQKADQYKMFPTETVWKGIHRSLHTRRKWYGLGLLFFLAGISYLASLQLMTPSGPAKKIQQHIPSIQQPDNSSDITGNTINGPVAVASNTDQHGNRRGSFSAFAPVNNLEDGSKPVTATAPAWPTESDLPNAIVITELPEQTIVDEIFLEQPRKGIPQRRITAPTVFPSFPGQATEPEEEQFAILKASTGIEVGSHELPLPDPKTKAASATTQSGAAEDEKRINWLQEYAVYELTPPPMRRWAWQLAFAPTMNYRKLSSNTNMNDQINIKGLPAGAIEGKPETLVSHQPALGFGLGSYLVYSVNKSLRITAGMQFNYSRYAIKAYTAPMPEAGKIKLDVARGQDSLVSYTRLRNFSGEKAEALQNQYFQLSAPIGMELTLLGSEKLQLNIAGTIQPTYLLNRNSYLITTDYKNYMRAPSLVRRWNVNAGAEIFVSYQTGNLKWTAGPQLRYQMLSSYVKEYPIREYLMEYGVKIGVTKTIR